jgi:ornithine cyclodeaminase/alanine dehydrogenase-like protein (mu-crystallin family)
MDALLLTASDIGVLLTPERCRQAVAAAFRQHGDGTAADPVLCGVAVSGGGFHVKAGVVSLSERRFVAKTNANFPDNPRQGLPTIQGLVLLFRAEDGQPLSVMDSGRITVLRTAAATAVAAQYLARSDAQVLTVCGSGEQGLAHVLALREVLPLRTVIAVDANPFAAERLARATVELGLESRATTEVRASVLAADVCVTCTPSRRWLIGPDDVRPGTFVAGVGADAAEKQELAPGLLARASVFVDVLEQSATIGDLHHALEAGAMTRADIRAQLGEVVTGRKPGRRTAEEITVFDSTGMALQDAAAASVVFDMAQANGHGVRFSFTNRVS